MPTLRCRTEKSSTTPKLTTNLSTSATSSSSTLSTAPSTSASASTAIQNAPGYNPNAYSERENGGLLPIPTPAMKIAAFSLVEKSEDRLVRENLLLGLAVEFMSFGGGVTVAKYKLFHPDIQAVKSGLTLFYTAHKKPNINLKNMAIDDQAEVRLIAGHTVHILKHFLLAHNFLLPTEECQTFIHPETEVIRQWMKRNPRERVGESAESSVKNLEEICGVGFGGSGEQNQASGSGSGSGPNNVNDQIAIPAPGPTTAPGSDFISTFTYVQDHIVPLLLNSRTELATSIQQQLLSLKDEINTHVTHRTIVSANLLFTHVRKCLEEMEAGAVGRAGRLEERLAKSGVGSGDGAAGELEEKLLAVLKTVETSIMYARTEQFTTKSLLENYIYTNQSLSSGALVHTSTSASASASIPTLTAPPSNHYSHSPLKPSLPIRSASTNNLAQAAGGGRRSSGDDGAIESGHANGNGTGNVNGNATEYGYESPWPAYVTTTGNGTTGWQNRSVTYGGHTSGEGHTSNGMTLERSSASHIDAQQAANSQQYTAPYSNYIPRSAGPSSISGSEREKDRDRDREDHASKRQKIGHEALGLGYVTHPGQQSYRVSYSTGPTIQINPATPNPPMTEFETTRQPAESTYYYTQNA